MLTPQLQLLLNQIGSKSYLDTKTGSLDVSIDVTTITDVLLLCRTIKADTLEKIEDFDSEDEKMFQGDLGVIISDDEIKLYWYSPMLQEYPCYNTSNASDSSLYLIPVKEGTLKEFSEAIKKMEEYHLSLRENEQFQSDAYNYILGG